MSALGDVRPPPEDYPAFRHYRGDKPPSFANYGELEWAKLFDYYGLPWLYEPRTFVLASDETGRPTESFTPDFYLPEQELYVEVTMMKQSLVTRKNRKLRLLRTQYPQVRAKLFYRRDFDRLFPGGHPSPPRAAADPPEPPAPAFTPEALTTLH